VLICILLFFYCHVMYPISQSEKLVEIKICKHCKENFLITDKDIEFLDRLSPLISGKKIIIPTPSICPKCRKINQLAWRNENKIYRRKCDATGKSIISHFTPDVPFKVYEENIWNSDHWNAMSYGKDFDFSKPFFEQFASLQRNVPRQSMATILWENSEYCNNCGYMKNSYLCFTAQGSEDSYYCVDLWFSNDCIDCYCIYGSHFCYECVLTYDSYNIQYAYDIKNCYDSFFLLSCEGCHNCYGCFNLVNQQFCIYNTPYTPEEYKKEIRKILSTSFENQKSKF